MAAADTAVAATLVVVVVATREAMDQRGVMVVVREEVVPTMQDFFQVSMLQAPTTMDR